MDYNRWSQRLVVWLCVGCALAGMLATSSSSQEAKQPNEGFEVGRYQMTSDGTFLLDTKTARSWKRFSAPDHDYRWEEQSLPWLKTRYEPEMKWSRQDETLDGQEADASEDDDAQAPGLNIRRGDLTP